MFSRKTLKAVGQSGLLIVTLAGLAVPGFAANEKIRIPVGHAEVVVSTDEVRTVAIAEPKIADAAVGSAKTVVVNAKSEGSTTLVVYNEGARYKVYDVEVFVPNGGKQIALHCKVAEVNDQAKRQLGFDFLYQFTTTTPAIDGSVSGGMFTSDNAGTEDGFIQYVRTQGDLALATRWRALEQKGDLRTLASPTLVAKSGEKATFLSGGELPVPIASAAVTVGGAQTVTIEWKEFGVRLNFTPTVMDDGTINLKVNPEVSQLDFTNAIRLSGFEIPALITRKASTTVNLKAGEYLVIGGLKSTESLKQVRKVPILGYIPILGFFFTDTSKQKIERELMVVVSPEMLEQASTTMPTLPTDRPEK